MTIPVSNITDTTPDVYKLTGPCSMATPCVGEQCPEHGSPTPAVTVEPTLWQVFADDKEIGTVTLVSGRWFPASRGLSLRSYPTQAEAVAAVLAHADEPGPCPTCGQAVSA